MQPGQQVIKVLDLPLGLAPRQFFFGVTDKFQLQARQPYSFGFAQLFAQGKEPVLRNGQRGSLRLLFLQCGRAEAFQAFQRLESGFAFRETGVELFKEQRHFRIAVVRPVAPLGPRSKTGLDFVPLSQPDRARGLKTAFQLRGKLLEAHPLCLREEFEQRIIDAGPEQPHETVRPAVVLEGKIDPGGPGFVKILSPEIVGDLLEHLRWIGHQFDVEEQAAFKSPVLERPLAEPMNRVNRGLIEAAQGVLEPRFHFLGFPGMPLNESLQKRDVARTRLESLECIGQRLSNAMAQLLVAASVYITTSISRTERFSSRISRMNRAVMA